MLKTASLYYFSPTGGTKRAAKAFMSDFATDMKTIDLGKTLPKSAAETVEDMAVVAAPVYGGRLPAIVSDKLKALNGHGKKAISLVVYGVRAYEDALLELNDILAGCGFDVIASAALIAQHSIVPEVGSGRPDVEDIAEIRSFAAQVLQKLDSNSDCEHDKEDHKEHYKEHAVKDSMDNMQRKMEWKKNSVNVPGNRPYKASMKASATPISTESCNGCGACAAICPTGAIAMVDVISNFTEPDNTCQNKKSPETTLEKCMMCMACAAHCPQSARILPAPVQERMNGFLGALKDIRRENEFYL